MEKINFILQALYFCALFLSAIYLLGVIWRTEMKLDKSYKFLFIALALLVGGEILQTIIWQEAFLQTAGLFFKTLFAFFFLAAFFETRSLLRDVDGEKNNENEPEK